MLVEDLIETLKKYPADADVIINYCYPVDGGIVTCNEDVDDVLFDKHSKTVYLWVKDSKEN